MIKTIVPPGAEEKQAEPHQPDAKDQYPEQSLLHCRILSSASSAGNSEGRAPASPHFSSLFPRKNQLGTRRTRPSQDFDCGPTAHQFARGQNMLNNPRVTALKNRRTRLLRVIAALAMWCHFEAQLVSGAVSTSDWPRFLGPNGNNISSETGLVEKWSTNCLPLVWQKEIGSGYSAPSILNNKLVLHHRVNEQEVVQCFEAGTGTSLWRYDYTSSFTDPFGYNNGPRCTPILTTDRCYTFGAQGQLCCLGLATGKPIWQRATAKEWNVPEPFLGAGSTPLLEDDRLIVMVGGQPNSALVALDAATGKTLWESGGQTNWQGAPTLGWPGEAPYRWTGEEKMASYSSPV